MLSQKEINKNYQIPPVASALYETGETTVEKRN